MRVPKVEQMHDDALCSHLEMRHPEALTDPNLFKPEPQREGQPRRLMARIAWEAFHKVLHDNGEYEHEHIQITDGPSPSRPRGTHEPRDTD